MSLEIIKSVVKDFISSKKSEVLVLRGKWGTGKTFTWHSLMREYKEAIYLKNYSYVSLFAVSDISDLRTAIYTKMISKEGIGKNNKLKKMKECYEPVKKYLKKSLNSVSIAGFNLGELGKIIPEFQTVAFYGIKNAVVCLDDFERMPEEISHEQLLGLITELKEQRNCKVVLIFNENELRSAEIYNKYREKLVDRDLFFSLSVQEATNLVVKKELSYRPIIIKYVNLLDINNIRILRKIVSFAELLYEKIHNLHKMVLEQTIMTLVLLIWCSYDSSDKKPSIDFLKKWDKVDLEFKGEQENNITEEEIFWRRILDDYGLSNLDSYDHSILKVVENGYIEGSSFEQEASQLNEIFKNNESELSFSNAWALLHSSFDDNEKELVESLVVSFKNFVHRVTLLNLDGTVTFLKKLGYHTEAIELIDYYFLERSKDVQIFDSSPFFSEIKNASVKDRFKEELLKSTKSLTLLDAIKYIIADDSYSERHFSPIENASSDDFYQLFKNNSGRDLQTIVNLCLNFPGPKHTIIRQNAQEALKRIGGESKLNAHRVERYDVKIPEI